MKSVIIGKASKNAFIVLLSAVIFYCIFEIVLYQSMLGPLNEFSGVEYINYQRVDNFDDGEMIYSITQDNLLNKLQLENVYIIDFTPRWSTVAFSYQYPNRIILEYKLTDKEIYTVKKEIESTGFVQYMTKIPELGDFIIYYNEMNKNLQYLIAINPVDRRLLFTSFSYRFTHSKSYSHVCLTVTEIIERINQAPAPEYNIRVLEYASGVFYSNKPRGIWITQPN